MNTSDTNSKQSAMARLLATHKSSFTTLKKGEVAEGTITKFTPSEILVDTGTKTEALVIEKDRRMLHAILALFHSGDKVEVTVINPESDSGQPLVSLRRSVMNIAWQKLEEIQEQRGTASVVVTDIIKGGFLVTTDWGISGFLPQSQTTRQQEITNGTKLSVYVVELNRKENKIILSQKQPITDDEFKAIIGSLKVGQKIPGTIVTITPVGMYVALDLPQKSAVALEGFIHISEVAWEKVEAITDLYSVGQTVEAVIVKFDTDSKRIHLSLKRLSKDPFEAIAEEFPADQKVSGTVIKVDDTGVTLHVQTKAGEEIEGFIRKEKIPPMTTYTTGQQATVLVSEVDKKRHRLVLVPALLEKPIGYR